MSPPRTAAPWSVALALAAALVAGVRPAAADPTRTWTVGATIGYGDAVGAPPRSDRWGDGQAEARVAVRVDVLRGEGPWLVGAELDTSAEVFDGGVGCGSIGGDVEVIAVGLGCFVYSVGGHALLAHQRSAGPFALRLGVGLGLTAILDDGGDELLASQLATVTAGVEIRRGWWLGVGVEGRAMGPDPRTASTYGVALERRR